MAVDVATTASRASTMAAWGMRNLCHMTSHAVSVQQSMASINGRNLLDMSSPRSVAAVSRVSSSSSSSSSPPSSSSAAYSPSSFSSSPFRGASPANRLSRFSTLSSTRPCTAVDRDGIIISLSLRNSKGGASSSCRREDRSRMDLVPQPAMESKKMIKMTATRASTTICHVESAAGGALAPACLAPLTPRLPIRVAKAGSEISSEGDQALRWKLGSGNDEDAAGRWGIWEKRAGLSLHAAANVGVLESQGCPLLGAQTEAGAVAAVPSISLLTDFDSGIELKVKKGEAIGMDGYMDPGAILSGVESSLGGPLGTGPQAPPQSPLIIVISGPSGVGKDTIIKRLQEVRKELHFIVTATTRPMRPGEVDGVDYFFVSKSEFQHMIENRELLEYAIVYGDYKGIPKEQVQSCIRQGKDVLLRVDVQGAATIRSIVGDGAVFIFIVAESEASLVTRLIKRKTETVQKMLVRVSKAREEATRMNEFDYVVVNSEGQLQKAVNQICAIIDAEKARVHPRTVKL